MKNRRLIIPTALALVLAFAICAWGIQTTKDTETFPNAVTMLVNKVLTIGGYTIEDDEDGTGWMTITTPAATEGVLFPAGNVVVGDSSGAIITIDGGDLFVEDDFEVGDELVAKDGTLANIEVITALLATYATATTVPYFDASKQLVSSSVTPTTLGYLDATSSVQGQLNAKAPIDAPTFTTSAGFGYATATTVPYFDASKNLVSSAVTPTTLGYLDATSSVQGQLNAKAPIDAPTFTTSAGFGFATATTVPYFDASKNLVSSAVTPTTLGYLDATSSVQGQFNAKAPVDSPSFTTTVGLPGPVTSAAASIEFTTNAKAHKTAVAPVGYLSATAIQTAPPFSPLTATGLSAGTNHIGSTEGYAVVDDQADYLLIGFSVPPLATLGAAADLDFEFDILEVAGEEVNIDIRFFEYGNTTPIGTDTLTVANGAARAFVSMDTHATGIGDLAAVGDWLVIEITANTDNDDFNIYGIRATYSVGIENDAT